jgi:hypothetical protein
VQLTINLNWKHQQIHLTEYLKGKLEGLSASYASYRQNHEVMHKATIPGLAFSFPVTPCTAVELNRSLVGIFNRNHLTCRTTSSGYLYQKQPALKDIPSTTSTSLHCSKLYIMRKNGTANGATSNAYLTASYDVPVKTKCIITKYITGTLLVQAQACGMV